jgi:hypothetical protein
VLDRKGVDTATGVQLAARAKKRVSPNSHRVCKPKNAGTVYPLPLLGRQALLRSVSEGVKGAQHGQLGATRRGAGDADLYRLQHSAAPPILSEQKAVRDDVVQVLAGKLDADIKGRKKRDDYYRLA